ncbi:amino acid adenylation domain-containing protein [Streptomyces sp. NPDC003023]|uniref:non-ribosomal peptide synthetase n=1 Tax=Streptomyces sp. NPDC003023 TaxID=3364675 RepID=UPI00368E484A
MSAHVRTFARDAPTSLPQTVQPTPLQEAYLVGQSDYFELGNVNAHLYEEFDIDDFDIDAANASIHALIDRHEVLRLVARTDGQLDILPSTPPYKIPVVDARDWDLPRLEADLTSTRERLAAHGPSTDAWPLFETLCYRTSDTQYRFFVSVSLLLLDVHTEGLLLNDFLRLYRDLGDLGDPVALSYSDYSQALHDETVAEEDEAWEYWNARLNDLPAAPELPLHKTENATHSAVFRRRRLRMSADKWARFKNHAAAAKITPTSALCTAYAEILAHWAKDPHFTLNILASRRLPLHEEVSRLGGNFGTTLPLAVDCRERQPFVHTARSVQTQLWDHVEYAGVSAIDISRKAARLRGWNSQSALPVVFASGLDMDTSELSAPPLNAREISGALQTPQVHLDHQVYEIGGELISNWDAVENLFPEGLLDELLAAYQALLERLADDESAWQVPAAQLLTTELPPLPTAVDTPCTGILHHAFLQQATNRPEQIAVRADGVQLSYGQVAQWSAAVAEQLKGRGIGPGDLVPVVMHKGWEQVVAVLGILRAGAAYLPIDAALPAARIDYLIGQSDSSLVITQPLLAEDRPWTYPADALPVDTGLAHRTPDDWLSPGPAGPQSLAYVIYTSGSTGLPKGVAIDHSAAMNTIEDINHRFAVNSGDTVLALSSLSFDLSVWDVFGMLAAGGTLVIPSPTELRDPARWLTLLRQEQVTIWNTVPALMDMLTKYAAHAGDLPQTLRLVMMSGDWIPVTLPDRIRQQFGTEEVISLGGATEASIWSILYPIDQVDPSWRSIPYGKAMARQSVHVLDDALQPRPAWAVGELYIAGDGVALGYWRDPERTGQRFITHPITGAKLYRTGDLARHLPDGNIEFLGREDGQVKIQGYRIELGEVESVLQRHEHVADAVVSTHKTANGNVLAAYVVSTSPIDADKLRRDISRQLPAYMVPTRVVFLQQLPLTGNGKVDRGALPDPYVPHSANSSSRSTPRDETERRLLTIWEEILESKDIVVSDDFFDIGGNSFAAMRVMAALRRDLNVKLPLSALFRGATVARLADVVREARNAAEPSKSLVVPIQPDGHKQLFYCVHPVGGNVVCYSSLARHLGDTQPLFGLEAPGLSGEASSSTIEEIAATYVRAVLEHSAGRSFSLGGWSMGGVIAFEMARQLSPTHPECEVVLIDSPHPQSAERTAPTISELAERFLTDFRAGGAPTQREKEQLASLAPDASATEAVRQLRAAGALPPDTDEQQVTTLFDVFTAHTSALASYRGGPHQGTVHDLRANRGVHGGWPAESSPWCTDAANTSVHVFDADHYSLVAEPGVGSLAETLMTLLANPRSSDVLQ